MVEIIQEKRRPSFGERVNRGLGTALQAGSQFMQQQQAESQKQQEQEAIARALGDEASGLPRDFQKMAYESQLKGQEQGNKLRGAKEEKNEEAIGLLSGAIDTVNRMKQLRKKGNLGIGATYSPFPETRKEAGEYEQLGKSLIQYATNIPIRNRIEFETLAEQLYDPNITDATAEGILNAMERIIGNSMESLGRSIGTSQNQQKRPPLSAFQR